MRKIPIIALVAAAGCSSGDATPRTEPVPHDSPRVVVDSVYPLEEEIRRFKADRAIRRTTRLAHGAASRVELVGRFVSALERGDVAQLQTLVLDAAEFIDLYYPASQFSRAPFKQSPELRWFLIQEQSSKGLRRLLLRYGGKSLPHQGHTCAKREAEGRNTVWDRCTVSWSAHAQPIRLFSTIIERDGQFKFLSYGNDL